MEPHCNGNNIYENDEDSCATDKQRIILNGSFDTSEQDRQSECCSSRGDADTCCSCSESSCLYAEADDPTHRVQIVKVAQN